jgi:5-methylcytosine-specific restriction endonuclease McrA
MSTTRSRTRRPVQNTGESAADFVRRVRSEIGQKESEYRRASLRIHGHFCANCGRQFDDGNLQLLTVHHIDGNHNNNPPDGSNWENLCIYCHEAEHSRELLANYVEGAEPNEPATSSVPVQAQPGAGFGQLGEALKKLGQQQK